MMELEGIKNKYKAKIQESNLSITSSPRSVKVGTMEVKLEMAGVQLYPPVCGC